MMVTLKTQKWPFLFRSCLLLVALTEVTQQEVEVVREQIVHVPKIIEQKRVQQRTVEQVVDIPIPQAEMIFFSFHFMNF